MTGIPSDELTREARVALTQAFERIDGLLEDNPAFDRGVIKFAERVSSMSDSRLMSNIHLFGSSFRGVSSRRGKIQVQPGAVSRRKSQSGTRQKIETRKRKISNLPLRKVATVRPHKLAKLVDANLPVAKKSGSHKMKSNVRYQKNNIVTATAKKET